jgi:hypothetical protein
MVMMIHDARAPKKTVLHLPPVCTKPLFWLAEFRRHGFADTMFGPATKLNVQVKAPEAAHVVSVGKVKSWLDGVGKNPGEQVEKNRLKYLLTR